jgi:hypothetical protein
LETVIRNPRIHSFAIIFAMNENGVRKYWDKFTGY